MNSSEFSSSSDCELHRAGRIQDMQQLDSLPAYDLRLTSSHTNNPEILLVYAELERGSRNHLRAFYRWKQRLGVHYQPTHLSLADFDQIANSDKETCH
jgi:hypothetical protein